MLKYVAPVRNKYGKLGEEWYDSDHLIELERVVKTYRTGGTEFTALKSINLIIRSGDFVGIVGKSGSGKSTLINMITGIDRPSSGEVHVGGAPIHTFGENQMARWRGRNLGVVFQFFQLLPMLTAAENVMLPMDFCQLYSTGQRRKRALELLDMVGVADQARKLPANLSGGQQQRVAIARALANDPPIIMADEPTGNLDSRTAENVFQLFMQQVAAGKTVVMVTHDGELAKRVRRTIVITDGELIEACLAEAFPLLSEQQLIKATEKLQTRRYPPGSLLVRRGDPPERLYVIQSGEVEVVGHGPDGREAVVSRIGPGQYCGEIGLIKGAGSAASARCAPGREVEAATMVAADFAALLDESADTKEQVSAIAEERLRQYAAKMAEMPGA